MDQASPGTAPSTVAVGLSQECSEEDRILLSAFGLCLPARRSGTRLELKLGHATLVL